MNTSAEKHLSWFGWNLIISLTEWQWHTVKTKKEKRKNQMAVTCMSFNKPELLEDMGESHALTKIYIGWFKCSKGQKTLNLWT